MCHITSMQCLIKSSESQVLLPNDELVNIMSGHSTEMKLEINVTGNA